MLMVKSELKQILQKMQYLLACVFLWVTGFLCSFIWPSLIGMSSLYIRTATSMLYVTIVVNTFSQFNLFSNYLMVEILSPTLLVLI